MKPQFQFSSGGGASSHSQRNFSSNISSRPTSSFHHPSTAAPSQMHTFTMKQNPHEMRQYHDSMAYKSFIQRDLDDKMEQFTKDLHQRRVHVARPESAVLHTAAEPTRNQKVAAENRSYPLLNILRERKNQQQSSSPSSQTLETDTKCHTRIVYDMKHMRRKPRKRKSTDAKNNQPSKSSTSSRVAANSKQTSQKKKQKDSQERKSVTSQNTTRPASSKLSSRRKSQSQQSSSSKVKKYTNIRIPQRPSQHKLPSSEPSRKEVKKPSSKIPSRYYKKPKRKSSKKVILPTHDSAKFKENQKTSQQPIELPSPGDPLSPSHYDKQMGEKQVEETSPAQQSQPHQATDTSKAELKPSTPLKRSASTQTPEKIPTQLSSKDGDDNRSVGIATEEESMHDTHPTEHVSNSSQKKSSETDVSPSAPKRASSRSKTNSTKRSRSRSTNPSPRRTRPSKHTSKKKRASSARRRSAATAIHAIRQVFVDAANSSHHEVPMIPTAQTKRKRPRLSRTPRKKASRRNSHVTEHVSPEIIREKPMYLEAHVRGNDTATKELTSSTSTSPRSDSSSDADERMISKVRKVVNQSSSDLLRRASTPSATKSEIRALLLQKNQQKIRSKRSSPGSSVRRSSMSPQKTKDEMKSPSPRQNGVPPQSSSSLTLKERLKQSFERSKRIEERLWFQKYGDILKDDTEEGAGKTNGDSAPVMNDDTESHQSYHEDEDELLLKYASPSPNSSISSDTTPPVREKSALLPPRENQNLEDGHDSTSSSLKELLRSHSTKDDESFGHHTDTSSFHQQQQDDDFIESLLNSEDEAPLDELEKTLEDQHRVLIQEGILSDDETEASSRE